MTKLIFGCIAFVGIIMTLALCKASGKANESMEYPERIILDGTRRY